MKPSITLAALLLLSTPAFAETYKQGQSDCTKTFEYVKGLQEKGADPIMEFKDTLNPKLHHVIYFNAKDNDVISFSVNDDDKESKVCLDYIGDPETLGDLADVRNLLDRFIKEAEKATPATPPKK